MPWWSYLWILALTVLTLFGHQDDVQENRPGWYKALGWADLLLHGLFIVALAAGAEKFRGFGILILVLVSLSLDYAVLDFFKTRAALKARGERVGLKEAVLGVLPVVPSWVAGLYVGIRDFLG